MKVLEKVGITLGALLVAGLPAASAQTVELVRGDVTGSLGVQSVTGNQSDLYRHRPRDGGFYGAASAGWYWSEHLKTEIDFGARTKGRIYEPSPIVFNGVQTYYTTDRTFWRRTVALTQEYQFFHNAWFHPYLGAGMNLSSERSRLHASPTVVYDPQTRTSRVVTPERTDNVRTRVLAEPLVQSGFKAYMTPRTFFRSDLRVAFRHGVDDVIARFGFGFDF